MESIFPDGSVVKNPLANTRGQVRSLGREDCLEWKMDTHSSIHAWEAPWREERGGLQSTASQRFGHDWACTQAMLFNYIKLWLLTEKNIYTRIQEAQKSSSYINTCIIHLTRQQVYKSRMVGWLVPSRPGSCGAQTAILVPWAPPRRW